MMISDLSVIARVQYNYLHYEEASVNADVTPKDGWVGVKTIV